MTSNLFYISTFYKFSFIDDLAVFKEKIDDWAKENSLKGLFIIAPEGVNATFSCPSQSSMNKTKMFIQELFPDEEIDFKDSKAQKQAFRIFKVKTRKEIVTAGNESLRPDNKKDFHLSPSQWNHILKNEKDVLLIDTRNWYETHIGKFKNAIDPNIDNFTDFPKYVKDNKIPKNKKILMYCTGGIRCEKAKLQLNDMGYEKVYQLDGGILKYLEEYPEDLYEGECFVFDHRVAVNQKLESSNKFKLCPHTGQPATIEIICARCDSKALIAKEVGPHPVQSITCSKNCAYHWTQRPGKKGPKQILEFKQ